MQRGGGIGGAERGEGGSLAGGGLGGLAGRWPDADVVLQGGMSEGLRDWDLWCVQCLQVDKTLSNVSAGALLSFVFCSVFSCRLDRKTPSRSHMSFPACSRLFGLVRQLSQCRSSCLAVTCMSSQNSYCNADH